MRVFGAVLAGLLFLGQSATAGTLRYELEIPTLELVSGSITYGSGATVTLTPDQIRANRNGAGLQSYARYFSKIFIELETDFLPFSLRNVEMNIFSSGNISVFDTSGPKTQKVYDLRLGFDFQKQLGSVAWLNGLTTSNALNEYRLRFDENGDIYDWRVGLDDDKPDFVSTTTRNSTYLNVADNLYDGYSYSPDISSDARWSSVQTGSWIRTGEVPSAVPLPASGLFLLTALWIAVASRRRKAA